MSDLVVIAVSLDTVSPSLRTSPTHQEAMTDDTDEEQEVIVGKTMIV